MLFDCWRLLDGRRLITVPWRSQRLVAFLTLRGPQCRGLLAGALWPDVDESHAQASLRAALSALNRKAPGVIETSNGDIWLADVVWVDIDEFQRHADLVFSGEATVLTTALHDPSVVGGDLLPGWSDGWVVLERERLQHVRLHVLEAWSRALVERGAYAHALEVALRAVEIDPLRESARRSVINVHLVEGNLADALREYERFRVMLRDELGVGPTKGMTELVRRATRADRFEHVARCANQVRDASANKL